MEALAEYTPGRQPPASMPVFHNPIPSYRHLDGSREAVERTDNGHQARQGNAVLLKRDQVKR
jgi:hypothetical protein